MRRSSRWCRPCSSGCSTRTSTSHASEQCWSAARPSIRPSPSARGTRVPRSYARTGLQSRAEASCTKGGRSPGRGDGRLDDLIVTGGEKVCPDEVEAVLRLHPRVADVAVAGRPDADWGERVVAFVVPRGLKRAPP